VTGNHITRPSPVTTKKLEKPNGPLGWTTVRRSRMHLTGPESWGSWPVSRPTGWNLLNYFMADTHNLEKRPWGNYIRVRFPGSAGEEVTLEGLGQPNLRSFAAHREDWELFKKVIDQSKIRWAISTFKSFKLAGTDGIVPALLQQGVEHLTTHLCHIFRACLARGLEAGQGDVYP
jgi:hypothetical protein